MYMGSCFSLKEYHISPPILRFKAFKEKGGIACKL